MGKLPGYSVQLVVLTQVLHTMDAKMQRINNEQTYFTTRQPPQSNGGAEYACFFVDHSY